MNLAGMNVSSKRSLIARDPDLIAAAVDGEMVMMSVKRGEYYGLNEVGARIWALLEQPLSTIELSERLCAEYEISPAQCQADVEPFIAELLSRGILRQQT